MTEKKSREKTTSIQNEPGKELKKIEPPKFESNSR